MDIGLQIKKLRVDASLSQEELADKIYVTRQTISNWENDKNYPDIKSLLLLSNLFEVSLDILVKGDIEIMKKEISNEDQKEWRYYGNIFFGLMCIMVVAAIPLFMCLAIWGIVIWGVIAVVTLYYAIKVEKLKKKHNLQTYREVVAFMEGESLTDTQHQIEKAKRPYQTIFYVIGSALIAIVVCGIVEIIMKGIGLL